MIWSQWNISLVHMNICTCQRKIWKKKKEKEKYESSTLTFAHAKEKYESSRVSFCFGILNVENKNSKWPQWTAEPKSLTLRLLSSQTSCCLFWFHRWNTGIRSITAPWTWAAPQVSPHSYEPWRTSSPNGHTQPRSWVLGANCTTLHTESSVYQRMSQTAAPAGSYIPEAQW